MARRRWTLVVVSNDAEGGRHFRVSRDLARVGIGIALLLVALVSSAAARVLFEDPLEGENRLARENALLTAELQGLRSRLDTLRGSLAELSGNDEYFRLLAGLDPLEPGDESTASGTARSLFTAHPLYRVNHRIAREAFSLSGDLNDTLRRARLLSFSWREAKDTLQWKYDRLAATPSILPTNGYVSSAFTHRRIHPILSRPRPHLGVDIVAQRGTPIVATANGRVRYVGYAGEYGLTIEIDHGHGYVTRYAHASRATVRVGQPVERGDMIGRVGDTGLALGPHVHYEVLINERQANPRRYILDTGMVQD